MKNRPRLEFRFGSNVFNAAFASIDDALREDVWKGSVHALHSVIKKHFEKTPRPTVATLIKDRNTSGCYHVEAEDADGRMEVTAFDGPGALDRAIFFAENYYDEWSDPQGLVGY